MFSGKLAGVSLKSSRRNLSFNGLVPYVSDVVKWVNDWEDNLARMFEKQKFVACFRLRSSHWIFYCFAAEANWARNNVNQGSFVLL